jgi:hypothetical protein
VVLPTYPRMAPLHGGSSAGKSDFCCGCSLDVVGCSGLHQSGLMSICFVGCPSPGPRKNDLTIYWALGPFVRSFTLLVDLGDICPPHIGRKKARGNRRSTTVRYWWRPPVLPPRIDGLNTRSPSLGRTSGSTSIIWASTRSSSIR